MSTLEAARKQEITREWIACGQWLIRCLPDILYPLEDVLQNSESSVKDLLSTLQDGVVLCHLLPVLSNNEIQLSDLKQFRQVTLNAKFIFKNNINAFLGKCESFFKLKEKSLFAAEDLINCEDAENVSGILKTLSELSLSSAARASGIEGFSVSKRVSADDIYYMEAMTAGADCTDGLSSGKYMMTGRDDGIYSTYSKTEAREEDVYASLVAGEHKFKRRASLTPGSNLRNCLQELVQTEEKYVKTLNLLVTVRNNLTEHSQSWGREEVEEVFKHLPEMLQLHRKILTEFKSAVRGDSPDKLPMIPKALEANKTELLIYAQYCTRLPKIQEHVEKIYKTEQGKAAETDHRIRNTEGSTGDFKLYDYITVPMQRILKYHLILDSLIKFSKDIDPKLVEHLKTGHQVMNDVTTFINEYKRDEEIKDLIDSIEESVDEMFLPEKSDGSGRYKLRDYGRLRCDGDLKMAEDPLRPRGSNKLMYCFLLDKLMVICKPQRGERAYLYKHFFIIKGSDSIAIDEVPVSNLTTKWSFGLSLQYNSESDAKGLSHVVLIAKTKEEMLKWKAAFQTAMLTAYPKNYNLPGQYYHYVTFKEPFVCDFCNKLLHGSYYQGYQCTQTHKKAHRDCIPNQRNLPAPILPNRPLPEPPKPAVAVLDYKGLPAPRQGPALIFKMGENITVQHSNGEWCFGSNQDGRVGYFPKSHTSLGARNLMDYPWFVGEVNRNDARSLLDQQRNGTFFVRMNPEKRTYAITLRYREQAKHILIETCPEGQGYYISRDRVFDSLPSLVEYYTMHSLQECFAEMDTVLQRPIRNLEHSPRYAE